MPDVEVVRLTGLALDLNLLVLLVEVLGVRSGDRHALGRVSRYMWLRHNLRLLLLQDIEWCDRVVPDDLELKGLVRRRRCDSVWLQIADLAKGEAPPLCMPVQ